MDISDTVSLTQSSLLSKELLIFTSLNDSDLQQSPSKKDINFLDLNLINSEEVPKISFSSTSIFPESLLFDEYASHYSNDNTPNTIEKRNLKFKLRSKKPSEFLS